MKSIYIITFFVALASAVQAQQTPIYNSYFLNSSLFNPSVNGIGEEVNLFSMHKQYLTGFNGNPTTSFLSIGAPLKLNKMGVGLNVYNDNQGSLNRLNVQGSYAYRAKIGTDHSLDFGLSLGLMQVAVDANILELQNDGDPLLANRSYSTSIMDGNFGLTYKFKNFKLEVAANQALRIEAGTFTTDIGYTPIMGTTSVWLLIASC